MAVRSASSRPAGRSPRQHEVADVHAGDQDDQQNGAEEDQHQLASRADHGVEDGPERETDILQPSAWSAARAAVTLSISAWAAAGVTPALRRPMALTYE